MRSKKLLAVLLLVTMPIAATEVAVGWLLWRNSAHSVAELKRHSFPGFSIELPKWQSNQAAVNEWGDGVAFESDDGATLLVEWSVGPSASRDYDIRRQALMKAPVDATFDLHNISGKQVYGLRFDGSGNEVHMATWACNDWRTTTITMNSKKSGDSDELWARMLGSIVCAADMDQNPGRPFPAVKLPESFYLDESADPARFQRWIQRSPQETVTVVPGKLAAADESRSAMVALTRQIPGALELGSERLTSASAAEGKRAVHYREGTLDGESVRLAFSAFACPNQQMYVAMHMSSSEVPLDNAVERLLALQCPTTQLP